MPIRQYVSQDLVNGLRVVNSPDPAQAQDAATKAYADAHVTGVGQGSVIQENAYWMQCAANSYAGPFSGIATGPNVQTIVKKRALSALRVKFTTTCFASTAAGKVTYGVAAGAGALGAIQTLGWFFFNNLSQHMTLPLMVSDFTPPAYSQVNVTGSVTVSLFIATTGSTVVWNTNTQDWCAWTISEIHE